MTFRSHTQYARLTAQARRRNTPARSEPLEDFDALSLRLSLLIRELRTTGHAGAAYGALTALERVLSAYQREEQRR